MPGVHSEHGKSAFSYYAHWLWNDFQNNTPLEAIPPLYIIYKLLQREMNESCCCFNLSCWFLIIVCKFVWKFLYGHLGQDSLEEEISFNLNETFLEKKRLIDDKLLMTKTKAYNNFSRT